MAQDNPYLQLVQDDLSGSVKGAMQVAADKNPDVEAKLLKLATAAGVPLEAARLDTAAVERQVALQEIDYKALSERYPSTAQLLADPVNAALAKDDVKEISFLEDALNFGANFGRSLGAGLIPKANAGLWGVAQAGAETAATLTSPLVGTILPANLFLPMASQFSQYRKEQNAVADAWRGKQEGMGFVQKSALSGAESLLLSYRAFPERRQEHLRKVFVILFLNRLAGLRFYSAISDSRKVFLHDLFPPVLFWLMKFLPHLPPCPLE
jgi:hypothetical protein